MIKTKPIKILFHISVVFLISCIKVVIVKL
jgi:hypothetical protein